MSYLSPNCLSHESVVERRDNSHPNDCPTHSSSQLILEPNTNIPRQVPQYIKPMLEKWKREESLHAHLHRRGPRSNCCDHRCSFHVPSSVECDKVNDAEETE